VREWRRWSELGGRLILLLDRVYAVVRAGKIIQSSQNVFLYRDGSSDGVRVEIGVEVASRFDAVDGVVYSSTPSGIVVSTVHIGPYSELGGAHAAIINWCKEQHLTRANVWWEVYGDWQEDPAQLQTEVFYLLMRDVA
jgi:effector-binding domain-containing protein